MSELKEIACEIEDKLLELKRVSLSLPSDEVHLRVLINDAQTATSRICQELERRGY